MIPWKGYRSKADCVRALNVSGIAFDDLVDRSGLSRQEVHSYVHEQRHPRVRRRNHVWRIELDRPVIESLRPEAARRNMTPAALARTLITRVVEHGLVGAVLDDGGAP